MNRSGRFPGSDRPDARFDAVVARGRTLRRQDRMRKVAVGSGLAAVLILALALSVLALGGGDTDQDTVTDPTPDSSIATTTTVLDTLRVSASRSGDDLVVSTVDPTMVEGARTCVRVNLRPEGPAGPSASETTVCWSPADGPATTVAQMEPTVVDIGCGAFVERKDPSTSLPTSPTSTNGEPTRHEFRFTLPTGLATGSYVAEIVAVTSTGDACPTGSPDDTDVVATDRIDVEIE